MRELAGMMLADQKKKWVSFYSSASHLCGQDFCFLYIGIYKGYFICLPKMKRTVEHATDSVKNALP